MLRFEAKVIVVVGATRGMGAATARRLVSEGATVILGGVSVERGTAFAGELTASGPGKAEFRRADLYDEACLKELMDGVARDHGRIDGLFNNGADLELLNYDADAITTEMDIFDKSIQVNLRGFLLACRYAIPHMIAGGGGAIVQTSSSAAVRADPVMVGYSCSKAGVDALSRHIAIRWGKQDIRCNTIHPGLIMTEHAWEISEHIPMDKILARTPAPRLGTPNDIAGLAVFLLSKDAAFVNGQTIVCDGGFGTVLNDVGTPDQTATSFYDN